MAADLARVHSKMRKPEVMMAKGGGGSSSSNSWGSGLCAKSCRLLQKWTSSTTSTTKKKKSSHVKGGNVHSSTKFKFGEDEDDLIIKLHALLGNRWSLIAGRLPGRTDNEVKNYWNSHLRKKLQNKGIDPDNRRSLSQTVVPTNFMTSVKAARPSYINDQVSDAVSSFSADYGTTTTTSPMVMPTDLNLDLTLTINPSPSSLISSCRFTETDQQHVDQFKLGNMDHHEHQFMKNETLVLFR